MRRSLIFVLMIIFLLTACGEHVPREDARQATLMLVLNDVRARTTANGALEPASPGQIIQTGGQAQSGEDSRARLDLTPEGTIVRIGPNTLFTLEALGQDPASPSTRLKLVLGQVWIILTEGSLDVETDYGTGAVRGSYMSVGFDPQQGMTVTCLEGHCSLGNAAGAVELTGGQASRIASKDQAPMPPVPINEQELQAWQEASPESQKILKPGTPPPPGNTDGKTPGGPGSTAPTTYTLINNCDQGVWHWRFVGPQGITVDVASGATVTGQLPAGIYTAADWLDNGPSHTSGPFPPGGNFTVKSCPDK